MALMWKTVKTTSFFKNNCGFKMSYSLISNKMNEAWIWQYIFLGESGEAGERSMKKWLHNKWMLLNYVSHKLLLN